MSCYVSCMPMLKTCCCRTRCKEVILFRPGLLDMLLLVFLRSPVLHPFQALLLCAILGMHVIMTVASTLHCIMEQLKKLAPYIVFIALLVTFCFIQVETTDFEEMPENWNLLIFNFIAFCDVGTVLTWLWYCKFGSTMEELKERMVEIERMREELL